MLLALTTSHRYFQFACRDTNCHVKEKMKEQQPKTETKITVDKKRQKYRFEMVGFSSSNANLVQFSCL